MDYRTSDQFNNISLKNSKGINSHKKMHLKSFGIERRSGTSVIMAALFLDENKTNNDGDDKYNGKKVISFY